MGKTNLLLFFSCIVLVAFISFASAFAVGSPYWKGESPNPMTSYPGTTTVVQLNIQNRGGATEDETAILAIAKGSEIASLQKTEYLVKAGEGISVPLTVSIPSGAATGNVYTIRVDTKTKASGTAGILSMGIETGIEFDVIIVGEAQESTHNQYTIYISLAIIAIFALIIYFLIRRKNK